jgi:hypothetical protein
VFVFLLFVPLSPNQIQREDSNNYERPPIIQNNIKNRWNGMGTQKPHQQNENKKSGTAAVYPKAS